VEVRILQEVVTHLLSLKQRIHSLLCRVEIVASTVDNLRVALCEKDMLDDAIEWYREARNLLTSVIDGHP